MRSQVFEVLRTAFCQMAAQEALRAWRQMGQLVTTLLPYVANGAGHNLSWRRECGSRFFTQEPWFPWVCCLPVLTGAATCWWAF